MKIMLSGTNAIILFASAVGLALPSPVLAEILPNDCVRGEPIPVFAASNPRLRSYTLLKSPDDGMRELVGLGLGESLEIRQWGCEYVVTTFRLESKQLRREDIGGAHAYLVAAKLLRRLRSLDVDSVHNLVLAAETLEAAVRRREASSFGQPFPVEGDGTDFLQTQVQIDRSGWRNGAGFVELSLFMGPL